MKYFMTQEEAVQAFNKLAKVESNTIFIVVQFARDRKMLIDDLFVLLRRFKVFKRPNGIRIKGTTNNPAKHVIIITREEQAKGRLAGAREENIIEL